MSGSIPSCLVLPHPSGKLSISLTLVLISWGILGQEARNHFGPCLSQIWSSSRKYQCPAVVGSGQKGTVVPDE